MNLGGDVGVPISVTINEAGVDVVTSLDAPNQDIQNIFTLILKMIRFSLSGAQAPEGLKADSGRLEGENIDKAVLELVHL